jgi:hypothetical protein
LTNNRPLATGLSWQSFGGFAIWWLPRAGYRRPADQNRPVLPLKSVPAQSWEIIKFLGHDYKCPGRAFLAELFLIFFG